MYGIYGVFGKEGGGGRGGGGGWGGGRKKRNCKSISTDYMYRPKAYDNNTWRENIFKIEHIINTN